MNDLWSLLFKTALLLALASVKRVDCLQALSVEPSCLELSPNDSKLVLRSRKGYMPKVLSTQFRMQVIALSAHPLCPVKALRVYTEHSSFLSASEAALKFLSKGFPDGLSNALALDYKSLDLLLPLSLGPTSLKVWPPLGSGPAN